MTRVLIVGCDGLLGQNLLRTAPTAIGLVGLARHESPAFPDLLSGYHRRDIADPGTWSFVRDVVRPDRPPLPERVRNVESNGGGHWGSMRPPRLRLWGWQNNRREAGGPAPAGT